MIKFGNKIKTLNNDKKYWVTSDLHFYHKSILKFCKNTRLYSSVEAMNEALINHWNDMVGVNDEVLHLGDFSFKGKEATQQILDQLNGNITFVLGNHCKVFRKSLPELNAVDYLEFNFNGTKVCCMHFPIAYWNRAEHGSLMIHGHQHGQETGIEGRILDVGFDAHGEILNLEDVVDSLLKVDIKSRR